MLETGSDHMESHKRRTPPRQAVLSRSLWCEESAWAVEVATAAPAAAPAAAAPAAAAPWTFKVALSSG